MAFQGHMSNVLEDGKAITSTKQDEEFQETHFNQSFFSPAMSLFLDFLLRISLVQGFQGPPGAI